MASEWREHPRLKSRFKHDHPDDLQVIIHDGRPRLSRIEPEIVWVMVTGMDGEVFRGRVRNQPHGLQNVHQGDEIKFVMPGDAPAALLELAAAHLRLLAPVLTGWLAPVLVTDKYLREREAWIIHPCPRCGLSELYDAPSDLIRVLLPPDEGRAGFSVPCPNCGGEQRVSPRKSPAGLEASYLETARLWAENMTAIGTLLASITDDDSAAKVLAEIDAAVARHKDLSAKLETFSPTDEKDTAATLALNADMAVSAATTQANAAFACSRAPGRAGAIDAAIKKLGLA